MKFFHAVLAVVALAHAASAFAGPGDPRLVNGVLEWPRTVGNEPFVVVRGDDGVLYYVSIATARREPSLGAGARVAVLGLEGRSAHEITALGVGSGESVEAALASLQGPRPAPAAPAAVGSTPAVSAPAPAAVPTVAAPGAPAAVPTVAAPGAPAAVPTVAAPGAPAAVPTVAAPGAPAAVSVAPAAPAPMATPPASGGAAAIAPPSANTAATPVPAAPSANSPGSAPSPAVSAPNGTSTAPAGAPPANGVITHPNVISVPVPPSSRATSAPPSSPPPPVPTKRPAIEVIATPTPATVPASTTDDRRWTEVSGVVESIVGRTLVLRSPEGRVAVDVSSLSGNIDRMITPGTTVRVYGVPVEMRFKALGFFDPGPRP